MKEEVFKNMIKTMTESMNFVLILDTRKHSSDYFANKSFVKIYHRPTHHTYSGFTSWGIGIVVPRLHLIMLTLCYN